MGCTVVVRTAAGLLTPVAVRFGAPDSPPSDRSWTWPRRARHSFGIGSFALSIRSRTQDAPPSRLSLSRCAVVIRVTTGTVCAPSERGFRPLPGRAPPRWLSFFISKMYSLFNSCASGFDDSIDHRQPSMKVLLRAAIAAGSAKRRHHENSVPRARGDRYYGSRYRQH